MTTPSTSTPKQESTLNPVQTSSKTSLAQKKEPTSESVGKSLETTPISNSKNKSPGISQEVINELSDEINNMLSFAVYNGLTVNTEVNALIQNSNVDDLINAHNLLCKNVAPATPKSIVYTKELHESRSGKSIFNRLPLLRNLILLTMFFLIAFIVTGMSKHVNNNSLDLGIMNSSGLPLLLNLTYLSSVAGLGVLFYLLKEVSTSLKKGTLVAEDSISYMSQILLGIIAGLILSEILSLYIKNPNEINLFNKSVLALVGGFSSDAIFSILQGVINKIKGVFITSNPT